MNWLQRIVMADLVDEDFIDQDGEALAADGDIGDYNHDMRAMEHIIFSSLEDAEDIPSLDPQDLTEEQLQQIEVNFPGFMESVWTGQLLPKEFAVRSLGWIRVSDNRFEVQQVDEDVLQRIANYIYERGLGGEDIQFVINEYASQDMVDMGLLELAEALNAGNGMIAYMKRKRPTSVSPATFIWD